MKHFRLLLTALLLWVGGANVAMAQSSWSTNTYEADGIQYYLNNTTHEAMIALGNYSGEIVVPEYIWPVSPGNQDGLVQANNPYWGGYRVTDYAYVNNSGSIQTPFSNNANITKVTLPQSIRAIKDGTFQNCTQLEEVRLLGCFFTNTYSTDTQSPTGTHSTNVFSGCTSLRRLYADDPRVVCVRRRWNINVGKWENYCPLVTALGTNTTTNLTLYHNAGVKLASYFPDRNVKQEYTTFTNSKLQVTVDFFPNGNVSYIDYGYTLNSLYACNVTETIHAITERQIAIDCPKQGSKTFVLSNVPNVSPYLKPYIKVGDADPVPMCIFGDKFYYTVYANPDANSNTNVRIMYMSSSTWGGGLVVETPGDITVYVDNQKKISDYQDAGTYSVASPEHPYSTYEVALDYDTLRYVVKAFDANNQEYQLLEQYGGMTNGVYRKGKYYFRTTGSASYLDYRVRLTATDIPMQIWYFDKPAGAKLTVSCSRKGIPYTFTYKNNKMYSFYADPEKPVTLKLENVRDGVIPYIIAARERLELQEGTNSDGTKYYEASYVPHYGANNDIQIGTTQIIDNGTVLSVNITKAGHGLVWIEEPNEDWYDFNEEDPEEEYIEGNPYRLRDMEEDGDTQSFEWAYDIDNIQTLCFVVPISESTNGIVETARVNVNGVDIAFDPNVSGNYDGEMWYYYNVPINGDLDIQLIHEGNARHLTVKNGDGNGSIEIYNPEGDEVLSVSTDHASSGEYLVRQSGYYAIIQPRAGKEVSAIFTTGMQQLLPPANYLQGDGIYLVPLAGFETNTTTEYQLSVLYADGAVEPWISYHHIGLIGSLGRFVNSLPESQKNAIEQLSVNMEMVASDLAAVRYLGGKPNYYTKPDTQGSLISLDLTDASLIESYEAFYTDENGEYKINTRNVIPYGFLAGLHLETLYLPKALKGFEEGALMNVNNNLVVYAPWKTPLDLSTSNGFGDEVSRMGLFVPVGSLDAYAADEEWGKFGFIAEYGSVDSADIIQFADAEVKRICVENWDTNGDGELSKDEAKAVTSLMDGEQSVFHENGTITSFDEFQYFTGLTSIEDKAFFDCQSLASVVLPSTITSIGKFAFFRCSKLENIDLPESLQSIDNQAFRVSGLKTLFIPKNVTTIGVGITGYCQNLVSIVVDGENTNFESTNGCNAIIQNGGSLKAGCRYTKIPEGVKTIQAECFYNNRELETIEIPSTVNYVFSNAFQECSKLTSMISKATTPPTLNSSLNVISTNCVLTVPKGTKEAYILAGWTTKETDSNGVFLRIEEAASTLKGDVNGDGKVSIADAVEVVNIILGNPAANARMRILEELEQE
jgi:hypothetical protein